MSDVRYATFPLDCRALKTANEKVWQDHPELGGRKLTTSYRKEWMDAYIRAGGQWQKAKPKLKPGVPLTTCQPAAATPPPKPQDSSRPTPQKNLDTTRKNLAYWEKLIPRLKSPGGVAEALKWRNANRRWIAEQEKELQLFEDDKNRYGLQEALRLSRLRRHPEREEDQRLKEATQQSDVITDLSKAAQEARHRQAEAKSPEDKKKFAEAAEALEDDVDTMRRDLMNFLLQRK